MTNIKNSKPKFMKTLKGIVAAMTAGLVLGGILPAQAGMLVTGISGSGYPLTGNATGSWVAPGTGQVIPDNTPAGVAYSFTFTDPAAWNITSISVTLNLTGGYNNDIYAYLSHGSTLVTLVNQIPGTAGSGSGFNNVILTEGAGSTIQGATGLPGVAFTGTYTADQNLSAFNGANPNGSWTIFFADLSPGDTSTLTGFEVGITAIPEPANVALVVFAGLAVAFGLGRYFVRKTKTA
jgi:subtilisin-like proprotein convertase family protein